MRVRSILSALIVFCCLAPGAAAATGSFECAGGPGGTSYVLLSLEPGQNRVRIIVNKSKESVVVPYREIGEGLFFDLKGSEFHFDRTSRLLIIRGGKGLPSGHAHCAP